MLKEKYIIQSTDMETKLNTTVFVPEVKIKATLIVAHGIGEHIGRYANLAKYLTEKGILVTGFDFIGHGESISSKKPPMYFGSDGSWKYLVDDVIRFNHIIKDKYPVPCFILGFSMGSFVVRTAMATGKLDTSGIILAGTGLISTILAKMVCFMIKQEAKKIGGDYKVSKKINDLAFGNYNKYFKPTKTDFDWLCSSEDGIKEYIEDPLTRKFITPGMFRELINGMAYTSQEETIRNSQKTPLLFLSGADDPVGDFGKSVKKVVKMYRKYIPNVEVQLFKDSRHDIFHDTCKSVVEPYIWNWMNEILK